jgi:predicted PurR-regulated permease PerM
MNPARPLIFWIAAIAAVAATVVLLHEILLPFVAGLTLAYLLDPIVDRLERIGLNRAAATLALIAFFIVAIVLMIVLAVPVIGAEIATLFESVPAYVRRLQAFATDPSHPWVQHIVSRGLSEAEQSSRELASMGTAWITGFLLSLWSGGRALISLFSLLVVTPIVTFYLIRDWKRIIATLDDWTPAAQRNEVRALAREIDDTISGFLRGQGTICLILAILYAVALKSIGLNHALLIGVASGVISFIPYLGSLTGLVISLCVAILQFWPNWTLIPVVLGIFLAGQSIADYVLAPYLVGSRVHLNPVWVMFAVFACGYLFGFIGLLVAVPLAAAIGVLVRFGMRQYRAAALSSL